MESGSAKYASPRHTMAMFQIASGMLQRMSHSVDGCHFNQTVILYVIFQVYSGFEYCRIRFSRIPQFVTLPPATQRPLPARVTLQHVADDRWEKWFNL